eukprot:TRINITY_DN504_c1_g1_i1.p1 TRINITY_DN504_c1_g1~~TRINITY_DN504_c1_g1_i1.p1  ORF type:complete len:422 (+),score=110.02 TRINITY_DN504_c1_g1_i1:34-1299(+)
MRSTMLWLAACAAAASDPCGCLAGSSCCRDTPDPSSQYVCCVEAATFCAAKDDKYPARCCPRWTVACSVGTVGCCDPAHVYNMPATLPAPVPRAAPTVEGSGGTTVYALVVSGIFSAGLHAMSVDPATGRVLAKRAVTGAAAAWYRGYDGESTRLFEFDPASKAFYMVDGGALLAIDAATGASTSTPVAGVPAAFPTGLAYDPDAAALVASFFDAKTSSYVFYKIPVPPQGGSAAAERVGAVDRGDSELASTQYYAGYMTRSYGLKSHRLGFQQVTLAHDPGLSVVDMAGRNATWVKVFGGLWSLDRVATGWLSLSATTGAGFTLEHWSGDDAQQATVANFTGCFPPTAMGIGTLGYVGTAVHGGTFAAFVMQQTKTKAGQVDSWAIASYDAATQAAAVRKLSPEFLLSDGVSLSGFGASD